MSIPAHEFAALQRQVAALSDLVFKVSPALRASNERQLRSMAQTSALIALSAALVAEIAGRSPQPFRDLPEMLSRMRTTVSDFTLDSDAVEHTFEVLALVEEQAAVYLRRGVES